MTGKPVIYLWIGIVAAVALFYGWKLTSRSAYEAAEYEVELRSGEIEVRRYPDLMLAATKASMAAEGNDGSFGRLFRYISGANQNQQKISMTVPVFMEPDGEGSAGQMGFVVPKAVAEQGAPQPTAAQVTLETRSGGRFAVLQFAGTLTPKTVDQAEKRLREWMEKQSLTAADAIEAAGYDPPWTPGFLRRNEVLIRIVEPADGN